MIPALVTGASVSVVALVVWGITFRRLLRATARVAELETEVKEWESANQELARALVHAQRAAASDGDGQRVLDKIVPRPSLSQIVSDSNG